MTDPLDDLKATPEDIRRSQIHTLDKMRRDIKGLLSDGLPKGDRPRRKGVTRSFTIRVKSEDLLDRISAMSTQERGAAFLQYLKTKDAAS